MYMYIIYVYIYICGVMVKALNYVIVVSDFELQSNY